MLTITEFAEFMKVTRQAVYKWLKEGMPLEINKPPRINKEKAVEWLKERR